MGTAFLGKDIFIDRNELSVDEDAVMMGSCDYPKMAHVCSHGESQCRVTVIPLTNIIMFDNAPSPK